MRYTTFRRYHDNFCRCDIGDISSVHRSRWTKTQSYRRVGLLNGSFRRSFGSFRCSWRDVRATGTQISWKAATVPSVAEIGARKNLDKLRPLRGAKLAIWLHFGVRVVETKLVNDQEVESGHCWSAVKHTARGTTNLRRSRPNAWRLNRQRSHILESSFARRSWH